LRGQVSSGVGLLEHRQRSHLRITKVGIRISFVNSTRDVFFIVS
jgi:hypothetical protein